MWGGDYFSDENCVLRALSPVNSPSLSGPVQRVLPPASPADTDGSVGAAQGVVTSPSQRDGSPASADTRPVVTPAAVAHPITATVGSTTAPNNTEKTLPHISFDDGTSAH